MFFATKFKIFSQVLHALWSYGKHRKSVIFLMKIFVKNFSHGKQTVWVFFCLVWEPSLQSSPWVCQNFCGWFFLNLNIPVIIQEVLQSLEKKGILERISTIYNPLGCRPSGSIVFPLIMSTWCPLSTVHLTKKTNYVSISPANYKSWPPPPPPLTTPK